MFEDAKVLIEHDPTRWPPVRVSIPDESYPFALTLFFAHLGDSPAFLGFETICNDDRDVPLGEEAGLQPAEFARLARNLPRYVDYARASIEWEWGDRDRALETLRKEAGKTRRGLPDRFYREIAAEYEQLLRDGDPHPLKTIADARPVHKSRASRWVKEARQRGYISEKKGKSHAS